MALRDGAVIFVSSIGSCAEDTALEHLKEISNISGQPAFNFSDFQSDDFGKVLVADFNLDTKYYSASTQLCVGNASLLNSAKFLERVEALLLFYESNSPTNFTLLKQVERSMRRQRVDIDIRLLICKSVEQKRDELAGWTAEHDFELVELTTDKNGAENHEADSGSEDDEPEYFKEKFGLERVLEALQCHRWTNAEYKEPQRTPVNLDFVRQSNSSREATLSNDQSTSLPANGTSTNGNQRPNQSTANGTAERSDEQEKGDSDGDGDKDSQNEHEADEFESLFEKFGEMKRVAASLKGDERVEYAEKMTKLFWNAMAADADRYRSNSSDSD